MLISTTVGHIIALYIISVFLISGNAAKSVNKTLDYKESSLEDTLPNIALEKFGNKYYYFGVIYEGNFFQAIQYCHYHGMRPLSIESVEETNFLIRQLKRFLGAEKYNFWTSGTILPNDHWVWLATGKPIVYTHWLPNEPNNWANIEKCLEAIYQYSDKKREMDMMWNDHDCNGPKYVICESSQANCVAEKSS
ncbi:perlucin-like [Anoplophora glabripennis]|uniref:perlucin-like n=1 Tax=Anoplophora glabripennis TaxID=217634 RepID=UPI0008754DE8|nr:perlucin-like [Anoplophora glabripennis]XP_023310150.1 perlucin-like [Anoplophora glabripennis]